MTQIQLDTPRLRLDALGHTSQSRMNVNLQVNRSIVIIRNEHNSVYGGFLSGDKTRGLIKLTQNFRVTLAAYLLVSKAAKKEVPSSTICIVLHGLRRDAVGVGAMLGSSGIYLQPPHGFHTPVPYFNPQYLHRPGTNMSTTAHYQPVEPDAISSTVFSDNDPFKYQVLEVFDAAQGPATYRNVNPSPRLKTPLKE